MRTAHKVDRLASIVFIAMAVGQAACNRDARGNPDQPADRPPPSPAARGGYGYWGPMEPDDVEGYRQWGMGPGMMGGYGRWGMGPGMTGGYGGWGTGPGMMGGYGRWGMGPGVMGGYGGWGMGLGMLRGYGMGPLWNLDLSGDQRAKIEKIADDLRRKHWAIMGQVMEEESKLRDLYATEQPDPKKVGEAYARIAKLRQEMLEAHVKANNDAEALLTKDQRAQLARWQRGGWSNSGASPPAPQPRR